MAESRYRHDLENAIEPFKGLLLGLFFVAIGMSMNLHVVAEHWKFIGAGVIALLAVKALVLYGFARFLGLPRYHRLLFAMVLAQGANSVSRSSTKPGTTTWWISGSVMCWPWWWRCRWGWCPS